MVRVPGRFKDDQGILRRRPSVRSSRISVSSLVDSNLRGSVEFEGTADEKLSAEKGIFESIIIKVQLKMTIMQCFSKGKALNNLTLQSF
jgi:hypothetical protein